MSYGCHALTVQAAAANHVVRAFGVTNHWAVTAPSARPANTSTHVQLHATWHKLPTQNKHALTRKCSTAVTNMNYWQPIDCNDSRAFINAMLMPRYALQQRKQEAGNCRSNCHSCCHKSVYKGASKKASKQKAPSAGGPAPARPPTALLLLPLLPLPPACTSSNFSSLDTEYACCDDRSKFALSLAYNPQPQRVGCP